MEIKGVECQSRAEIIQSAGRMYRLKVAARGIRF
jgi:ribosomal protein L28